MLRKLFGNDLYCFWILYPLSIVAAVGSFMIDTTKGGFGGLAAVLGQGVLGGVIFMHIDYLLERRRFKKTHPE